MPKLPKLSTKLPTLASEALRRMSSTPAKVGHLSPSIAAKIRAKANRILGT